MNELDAPRSIVWTGSVHCKPEGSIAGSDTIENYGELQKSIEGVGDQRGEAIRYQIFPTALCISHAKRHEAVKSSKVA